VVFGSRTSSLFTFSAMQPLKTATSCFRHIRPVLRSRGCMRGTWTTITKCRDAPFREQRTEIGAVRRCEDAERRHGRTTASSTRGRQERGNICVCTVREWEGVQARQTLHASTTVPVISTDRTQKIELMKWHPLMKDMDRTTWSAGVMMFGTATRCSPFCQTREASEILQQACRNKEACTEQREQKARGQRRSDTVSLKGRQDRQMKGQTLGVELGPGAHKSSFYRFRSTRRSHRRC